MFEGLFSGGGGNSTQLTNAGVGTGVSNGGYNFLDSAQGNDPSMWDRLRGMFGGAAQGGVGGTANAPMNLYAQGAAHALPSSPAIPQMHAHAGAQAGLPQLSYGALGADFSRLPNLRQQYAPRPVPPLPPITDKLQLSPEIDPRLLGILQKLGPLNATASLR